VDENDCAIIKTLLAKETFSAHMMLIDFSQTTRLAVFAALTEFTIL